MIDPVSPMPRIPFVRHIAAGYELMYWLGKEYEKPPFAIRTTVVGDKTGGISEQVRHNKAFCTLLHFRKNLSDEELAGLHHPKVLLVAPLSDHHSTFKLGVG